MHKAHSLGLNLNAATGVADACFIIDVIINFRSAYFLPSGILEADPREIARTYCRTWFPIDFLSCLPVQYVVLASEGDAVSGLKSIRLMRLAKLLRLARLRKLMDRYEHLAHLQPLISFVTSLFGIFFAAHLLACMWYFTGTLQEPGRNGTIVEGWVTNPELYHIYGVINPDAMYMASMYSIFKRDTGFTTCK